MDRRDGAERPGKQAQPAEVAVMDERDGAGRPVRRASSGKEERICGALALAAIGDAMGAATENLSFDQIREHFGGTVETLLKPGETAFALGNKPGEVTDDFSQVYFILQEVLRRGGLSREGVVSALLAWADEPRYFDRFAGPTTRAAVVALRAGKTSLEPAPGAAAVDYAAKATNGAAMKVAPAALLHPGDVDGAIAASLTITQVTHDNSLAVSGAAAVAAACAAGLGEGASLGSVLAAGLYGVQRGLDLARRYSREVPGASIMARMRLAFEIAEGAGPRERRLRRLGELVGSGLLISEAVPCAFGILAMSGGDALQAVVDAVNIGYDTDTVACIVGTMAGPFADLSDPRVAGLLADVQRANGFDLVGLAGELAALS